MFFDGELLLGDLVAAVSGVLRTCIVYTNCYHIVLLVADLNVILLHVFVLRSLLNHFLTFVQYHSLLGYFLLVVFYVVFQKIHEVWLRSQVNWRIMQPLFLKRRLILLLNPILLLFLNWHISLNLNFHLCCYYLFNLRF